MKMLTKLRLPIENCDHVFSKKSRFSCQSFIVVYAMRWEKLSSPTKKLPI